MSDYFFSALWPGLLTWCLLYISDYALTIRCARLYRSGVNEKLVLEGSYEITPYYQKDIDSLRRISPRFIAMLLVSGTLVTGLWYLTASTLPEMYRFALGALILVEFVVHIRHLHNLYFFRVIINSDTVRGRIEYSRTVILRMSGHDLLVYSAIFFLLFGITQDWFMLGGAVKCLATSVQHRKLATKSSAIGATRELQAAALEESLTR